MAGAEECLVRGLRVILNQGGDNLTQTWLMLLKLFNRGLREKVAIKRM